MTPTTNHSRAAAHDNWDSWKQEARAHYERLERDAHGRWMPEERFEYLQRYFNDPVFKAEQDAEREKMTARNWLIMDAGQVKYYTKRFGSDVPWFIPVLLERVINFARDERDYQLLIFAGISHEEACEIVNGKPECNA